MTPHNKFLSNPPKPFRLSTLWDIYIPITIAIVPAGIFTVLGLVTEGLDKPVAKLSAWVIVTLIALETLGIIAMVFVTLMRFDFGLQQLSLRTNGNTPGWRKLILMLSIVCILLFDIFTNVATAFAGVGTLVVFAILAFFAYLLCIRDSKGFERFKISHLILGIGPLCCRR